jgi:hypothetical protein
MGRKVAPMSTRCQIEFRSGDVEYYYVVRYDAGACTISAHEIERSDGVVRVGRLVAAAPAPFFYKRTLRNLKRGRARHVPLEGRPRFASEPRAFRRVLRIQGFTKNDVERSVYPGPP